MTERTITIRLVFDTSSGKAARETLRGVKEEALCAGQSVDKLGDEATESGRQMRTFGEFAGAVAGRIAALAAGVLSVGVAFKGLAAGLQAADNFRALDNRIKLVTDSAEEFETVQQRLIQISRDTFGSIEGTVQAYQRMAGAVDRLGISQDRLLSVSETVNKAVALSGATAQASESSLIQFGQALSNNFQASAQEINSLNEQVFALSDAIAAGITKVTGVETFRSDLKRLAEDGKLSSDLVIRALEAIGPQVNETFDNLDRTFSQIASRLKTNAQVIADEAFGPLLEVKIDFYSRVAQALEDPRIIVAARKFGATLVDIANEFEKNADTILKTIQGIGAGLAVAAAPAVFAGVVAGITSVSRALIALGAAAVANPLLWIPIAVAGIVTFRDEITRALTPFKSFSELAEEVGPIFRGAFEFAKDIAQGFLEVLEDAASVMAGILKDLPKLPGSIALTGPQRASEPFRADSAAGRRRLDAAADLGPIGQISEGAIAATEFVLGTLAERGREAAAATDAQVDGLKALAKQLQAVKDAGGDIRISDIAIASVSEFEAAIDKAGRSIDLTKEKLLNLNEGSGAVTLEFRGEFVNIPTLDDGKVLEAEEAIQRFRAGTLDAVATFESLNEAIEAARTGTINIGEIRFDEGFDKAILTAGELQDAIKDLGVDAKKVFDGIAKQGVFIFPQPLGREARESFTRPSFDPKSLIIRTEEEQKALEVLAEKAEKARREVEALFSREITKPFEDTSALLNAALISDEALEKAQERLEIEQTIAGVRKGYEDAGIRFSKELENSAREQLQAVKDMERAIERAGSVRQLRAQETFDDNLSRTRQAARDVQEDRLSRADFGDFLREQQAALTRALQEGTLSPELYAELMDKLIVETDVGNKINRDGFERVAGVIEALDIAGELAEAGSQIFDSLTEGILALRDADGVGEIAGAISGIGRGIGGAISQLSALLPALGPVGAAISAVGQIAGFVESAIGFFKAIFSKPSGFFARATLDFDTGTVFGRRQRDNSEQSNENAQGRDTFLDAVNDVVGAIQDITGALSSGELSVEVNSREGIIISGEGFGPRGGPANPQAFTDPDLALDAAVKLAVESLQGGNQALVEYAKAALQAGRDTQDLVDGLQALQGAFSLAIRPLSEIEKQLKSIDDVVNPVIADLQALGQSIAAIQDVAKQAARAVGTAFIDDIQQRILDQQNSVLGDYRRLLKEIEQRQKDATTLLARGAITPGEFESVQFLAALEATNFFKGLSPEDVAALGDFFGLLGDEIGQAAAALAKLELGIQDFVDNVFETIERLKQEAESIQDSVDRARDTRSDILREFSPATAGEQLRDLRGELFQILQSVQAPEADAEFIADQIDLASDLARQFVDLSAELFGPTAQFGQNRDFATSILQQIADAGQAEVNERLALIEAAEKEVAILQEIRDLIASPEPSLAFIQQVLDENRVTNTILRDLLAQYIAAANAVGIVLDPSVLQAQADQFLNSQGLAPTQQPSTADSGAVVDAILRANADLRADNQKMQAAINQLVDAVANGNIDQRELIDLQRVASGFR